MEMRLVGWAGNKSQLDPVMSRQVWLWTDNTEYPCPDGLFWILSVMVGYKTTHVIKLIKRSIHPEKIEGVWSMHWWHHTDDTVNLQGITNGDTRGRCWGPTAYCNCMWIYNYPNKNCIENKRTTYLEVFLDSSTLLWMFFIYKNDHDSIFAFKDL